MKTKRFIKITSIILGSIAGLLLIGLAALEAVLGSDVPVRLTYKYAPQFLNADLHTGSIKATALRSFPNLSIKIADLSLTYPHSRFAAQDSLYHGAELHASGCGEEADTLLSAKGIGLSLNYLALLKGEIRLHEIVADSLRLFAKQYDSTAANWNIMLSDDTAAEEAADTTASTLPAVVLRKLSLTGSPLVVYSSPSDTIAAKITADAIRFDGLVDISDIWHRRLGLNIDSLRLYAALPEIKADAIIPSLGISERRRDIRFKASAESQVSISGLGDISIPAEFDGSVFFPHKAFNTFKLKDFRAKIAMLEASGNIWADIQDDRISIDGEAQIDDFNIAEFTGWLGNSLFPEMLKLKTDAKVSLTAICKGDYVPETKELPELIAGIELPRAHIAYDGIDYKGFLQTVIEATTDKFGKLNVNLADFDADFSGIRLTGTGSVEDALNNDPLFNVDFHANAAIDSLCSLMPEGYRGTGNVNANFNGLFFLSDMDFYNFAGADLDGGVRTDGIRIRCEADTLDLVVRKAHIALEHVKDAAFGAERLAIHAKADSLDAKFGKSFFRGNKIEMLAQNAVKAESEEFGREFHPIVGTLSAAGFGMAGADSLFIGLLGTKNTFRYSAIKNDTLSLPKLSFKTDNKVLLCRYGVTRAGFREAGFSVSAEKRGIRTRRQPNANWIEWAKSVQAPVDDFSQSDMNFRIGESMAKYVRQWNINGNLDIEDSQIITPFLPLENRLCLVHGSFNNNEIVLDSLTFRAGDSDISAQGKVSGLRRAMLRGGDIDVNLKVISEYINADELLQAVRTGSNFSSSSASALDESLSDEEYLEQVQSAVADTTYSTIVVPANINAELTLEGSRIDWTELSIPWFASEIRLRDRCVQITNTTAESNVGDIYFEGFYATKSKSDISAGFDLNMVDITADKVIALMPAVDSIIPMLKSFKGSLDCELAATSGIDTTMNLIASSLKGVMMVKGRDLELEKNEALDAVARVLMLKGKKVGKIDDMSVQGVISDNTLEVFPFVLGIDRYKIAMSGLQNFDQSFKYHVSVLKSPVPFRFGIDLSGNFDKWKFRLGKAKYKSVNVPVFTSQIDNMHVNLVDAIHNIFATGADAALARNKSGLEAINLKKDLEGYDAAGDIDTEGMTGMEKIAIEALMGKYSEENDEQ